MAEPRLLDQVRRAVRLRHYSVRTEEAYVAWVRRYVRFSGLRHPTQLGAADVNRFLAALAETRRVSASTQTQALSALLFLYRRVLGQEIGELDAIARAKSPVRLPVVLTRDEVDRVLGRMSGAPRLAALLMYGAGLRLSEVLQLRVKDLDFTVREITIRRAKGGVDRVTMLPGTVVPDMQSHLERVRRLLRAYGWTSTEELVILGAEDATRILGRYLSGELSVKQVEYWAELLEMRDDVGFEERWGGELRRTLFVLANPEINEPLTPALAIKLRRFLAGEAA